MFRLDSDVDTMYHISMKVQINQWGNSLAIRIPKSFAQHMKIEQGSEVEMSLQDDSIVVSKPRHTLDDLLKNITPETIHGESDFGSPQGKEIW